MAAARLLTAVGLAAAALIVPAQAGCYESVGCTNRDVLPERFLMREAACEILWQIRNQIYHENGYCFRTPRGIAAFGNANCRYSNVRDVPLNRVERINVGTVIRVERAKRCPG